MSKTNAELYFKTDSSGKVPKRNIGIWTSILHHETSLAILATGLHDPLKQMGLGKLLSWLEKTDCISKSLLPVLTLVVVTILFIFGLEVRKRIQLQFKL